MSTCSCGVSTSRPRTPGGPLTRCFPIRCSRPSMSRRGGPAHDGRVRRGLPRDLLLGEGPGAHHAEMQAIGGMFTPQTAPVVNRLAAEFAVFTRWFCEAPTCTFPNRSFYHGGTSLGKVDNESVVSYAWDQEMPNLFDLLTTKGIDWRVYFDTTQVVPDCAINLAGLRHIDMWRSHSASRPQFFADAAAGRLPPTPGSSRTCFSRPWTTTIPDRHPGRGAVPGPGVPGRPRLAAVAADRADRAVRRARRLLRHAPRPAAPVPDDHPGEQGFGFDRFGLRVPALSSRPTPNAARSSTRTSTPARCCARCASGSTWDRR